MKLESFCVSWDLLFFFLVFLSNVFTVPVGANVCTCLILTLLILGCDLYVPMTIEPSVQINRKQ
jgi:hypothetical protein